MKRIAIFFLLLYAGLWCLQQAPSRAAGWLPLASPASGGGSVNWTFTASPAFQAGTANPQSFTSVSIGTAASNRYVIVCAAEQNNGPFTAVTIGGVSATVAIRAGGGNGAELWYANVTSGTTATINLTSTTASPTEVDIIVGIISTNTAAPNSTAIEAPGGFNADPQVTTSALTVNTNGVGVACGYADGLMGHVPTWNVGTQDANVNGTGSQLMLGHILTTGSQTPSISNFNFASFSIAAASWGP